MRQDKMRHALSLSQTCLNSPHTSRQVKIFCRPTKSRLVCSSLKERPALTYMYLDDAETENNPDNDKQQSIYNHSQYHQFLMSILFRANKWACHIDCKENYVYHGKWSNNIFPDKKNANN